MSARARRLIPCRGLQLGHPIPDWRRNAMTLRIESYGLIGDCKAAALVGRDGSIDWLCWPRFDSDACFARLLGGQSNGFWLITPSDTPRSTSRRYRPDTLILETVLENATGKAAL